jgi:putative tryptophan/tyrosine transport system substrate-binding protein
MNRREFVAYAGGAIACPLMARAQPAERKRRIGVIIGGPTEADPESAFRVAAFTKGLQELGWAEGRNVHIDYRWAGGSTEDARKFASELVALAPDVILASGTPALASLLQATSNLPIVFVNVTDPIGAGYVKSLARPGGNATGFMQFEYSVSAKWLELLKEIAPGVKRAAILRDPTVTSGIGQFAVVQSVASSIGVDITPINVREAGEIAVDVATFARTSDGGLIVTSSALSVTHRKLIIALAAQYNLPTVYYRRLYVTDGGLVSYGYDIVEQYRRAAGYVDRILKGEKPSDLPVQAPTKYELVINLKTAKALGLTVPPSLLARADEVIE